MAIEIRPLTRDDIPNAVAVDAAAFGWTYTQDDVTEALESFELERLIGAFEDGHLSGTAGAFTFQITVPGKHQLPAAGVTAVAVLPTRTRRGILTSLMHRQIDDLRERGDPLAILYASESAIYGRFGYGLATTQGTLRVARKRTAIGRTPSSSGALTLVDKEEARRIVPGVFDRFRRQTAGQVDRPERFWTHLFRDLERNRNGASGRFYVVYEEDGEHRGYVSYRIKENWTAGLANNLLRVHDLVATTDDAYVALVSYCLDVDLVGEVELHNRPADEPLRWMLADPRQLRSEELEDALWVRVVDVPTALQGRRYMAEGTITFEIEDKFCPDNSGTYRLEGGPSGASCRRTDGAADISMAIDDLGALYLGGVSPFVLARAGRVVGHKAGALATADLMFRAEHQPWISTHF